MACNTITIADVGIRIDAKGRYCLNDLDACTVRDLLEYNAATGVITRRKRAGKALKGSITGTKNAAGHLQVSIKNKLYMAHRLAWLWMTGVWPSGSIDHINGVRDDNRWANLRDVDDFVNAQNQRVAHANSVTGLLGVHFESRIQKFRAQINIGGKRVHLGVFATQEAAFSAYLSAKNAHHPGFIQVQPRGTGMPYEQRKGALKAAALDFAQAHQPLISAPTNKAA